MDREEALRAIEIRMVVKQKTLEYVKEALAHPEIFTELVKLYHPSSENSIIETVEVIYRVLLREKARLEAEIRDAEEKRKQLKQKAAGVEFL